MERLTDKEMCNFTNMEFQVKQIDWHSIYNKLADFEDFMEEQGFESLEDLQRYIELSIKISGIVAKKRQEIRTLKDRWQKLKDYIKEELETDKKFYESDNYSDYYRGCKDTDGDILYEMQELEKEIK